MKILGLEFSSTVRSVAIGEKTQGSGVLLCSTTQSMERHVTGLVLIDRALREAKLAPAEIDIIAVGLGPGSYAGVRSAIALSQGWQLARGTRLVGVGSVELLAAAAREREMFGDVTLVTDAQRHECYRAVYRIDRKGYRQLAPLAIVPLDSLVGTPRVAGPEAARLFTGATDLFPNASTLVHMAAERTDFVPGEQMEPIYLRETTFVKAPPTRFS